ncbi:ABC-2 type transporter [archaeon GW2011_AR15]|nr:ABC-2 type transporter [archaeon GW2011_AR15]
MQLNVPHYQHFLLLGILVWNYFSEATSNSLSALMENSYLLKKHKVSPYIFVISSCLSNLVGLLLSFAVFLMLLIVFGIQIKLIALLSIFYMTMLFLLTIGVSLLVTGAFLNFKDTAHIWSFLLLIGFWLSPIIYSEQVIPLAIRGIYMLNPLARIISHLRNIFIYDYVDLPEQLMITFILCMSILLFGLFVFDKMSKDISEKL